MILLTEWSRIDDFLTSMLKHSEMRWDFVKRKYIYIQSQDVGWEHTQRKAHTLWQQFKQLTNTLL